MKFHYEGSSKLSGIYEIKNKVTNKSCIGSAARFKERWRKHSLALRTNKHSNKHLQRSYNDTCKSQENDHFLEFCILEVMKNSTKQERLGKEECWIAHFLKEQVALYNINLFPTKQEGSSWSRNPEESKRKLSQSSKKTGFQPGHIPWHKGRCNVYSQETIKEMSMAKKGENHPHFGKHHPAETKMKIGKANSIALKGKPSPRLGCKSPTQTGRKHFNARCYEHITLADPTGIVYNTVECVAEFAREHGLICSGLQKLLNGQLKTHKGWRLLP